MKSTLLTLLFAIAATLSYAQGTVRGVVKDVKTQEPIPFASVKVKVNGQNRGTTTDFDGEYQIKLPAGSYTLIFNMSNDGYLEQKKEITIADGAIEVIDVELSKDAAIELITVEIVAEKTRIAKTVAADDKRRMDEPGPTEGMTEEQMKERGAPTVIDAAQAVPGVTIEDGKSVYIRGLGDRYTKTILNGMEIPGLDPDRNSVQLDIFPTAVVANLTIYKTFLPNWSGDYTGGLLNITTKDLPKERYIYAKAGLGYNNFATFNNDYLTYDGGSLDFLGFDDGNRELPFNKFTTFSNPVVDDPELTAQTMSFNRTMATARANQFMNQTYAFGYGNRKVFRDTMPPSKRITYGYNIVANYRNSHQFFEDVEYSEYRLQSTAGVAINELEKSRVSNGQQSQHNVLWTALIGQSVKWGRSKIDLALFHTQNGMSSAALIREEDFEDNPATLERTSLEYTQRSVSNANLAGRHFLDSAKAWTMNWTLSPTLSRISDPDIRATALAYEIDPVTGETVYDFDPAVGAQTIRIWRSLNEYNIGGRLDFTYKFKVGESDRKSELKFGGLNTYRERDFEILQYIFDYRNGSNVEFSSDPDWYFLDENIWNPDSDQGTFVNGNFEPANTFNARQNVIGTYVMNELPVSDQLNLTYGARVENAKNWYTGQNNLGTQSFTDSLILDNWNVLPSLNAVYKIEKGDTVITKSLMDKYNKSLKKIDKKLEAANNIEDVKKKQMEMDKWSAKKSELDSVKTIVRYDRRTNFRGAYATTLARPSFKEKSLAQIFDPLQGRTYNGNIDLLQTTIHNFDARWEYFFGRTELLSASAFYKHFIDPIELISFSNAPDDIQPLNTGTAQVFGAEIEARKAIGFNKPGKEHLSFVIGANFTYVVSRVDLRESFIPVGDTLIQEKEIREDNARVGEVIGDYRQMYGQSPYIINAFATFRNDSLGWKFNVSYNVQGRKLAVIGIGRIPDVFEMPFHALSFKASKRFGNQDQWQASLTGRNLLLSRRVRQYESFGAVPQIYSAWSPGFNVTAAITYNLVGKRKKESPEEMKVK